MAAGDWITQDLSGTKNGSNVTFTISNTPVAGTILVIHNGAVLHEDATPAALEYSRSGITITIGVAAGYAAPASADNLWAQYQQA